LCRDFGGSSFLKGNELYVKIYSAMWIAFLLFGFSFVFNFIWESLQAVYLYQGHDLDARTYVPMMVYVSSVDGLLILGMYLLVSLLLKNLSWPRNMRRRSIGLFLLLGLFTSATVEYVSVHVLSRWAYLQTMPTLFGIGLSPLLQLDVTGLLSLWITRRILFGKGTP